MAIAIGALIVAIFSSYFIFSCSYRQEVQKARVAIQQLLQTVKDTAAIAAYLNQKQMAQEVIDGLSANSIVSEVSFVVERSLQSNGFVIGTGSNIDLQDHREQDHELIRLPMSSPFSDDIIGELILLPNESQIESQAIDAGISSLLALALQTLLTALLALFLVGEFLSQPIVAIARRLHKMKPGESATLDMHSLQEKNRENEIGTLISDIDILLETTRKKFIAERTLRETIEQMEQHYRTLFSKAQTGIFKADFQGRVHSENVAFTKLVERSHLPVKSSQTEGFLHRLFKDPDAIETMMQGARKERISHSADLEFETAEGSDPIWVHLILTFDIDENTIFFVHGVIYDITERYLEEHNANRRAETDHLTGLYNRRGGEGALKSRINKAIQKGDGFVLMLIDLDSFKSINDQFGHDAGDLVLKIVTQRLIHSSRKYDILARWGGDEFLYAFSGDVSHEKIFAISGSIIDRLSEGIKMGDDDMGYIGGSVGIAIMDESLTSLNEILRVADKCMYRVKSKGKNGSCIYDGTQDKYLIEFRTPSKAVSSD